MASSSTFIFDESFTFFNNLQSRKTPDAISCTESGISIFSKLSHAINALLPMFAKPSFSFTSFRFLHPPNAIDSIDFTFEGISIDVILSFPANAEFPIVTVLSLITYESVLFAGKTIKFDKSLLYKTPSILLYKVLLSDIFIAFRFSHSLIPSELYILYLKSTRLSGNVIISVFIQSNKICASISVTPSLIIKFFCLLPEVYVTRLFVFFSYIASLSIM